MGEAHAANPVGNYAPTLSEGDIVVVNRFGSVVKLNERTTGQTPEEIAKRLGGLDLEALPNLTEATRITQRDPALGKMAGEVRLAWSLNRSSEGFAAALDERGQGLARVTVEDAAALAKIGRKNAPTLSEGDIVVVNRFGSVVKLNERTTGQTPEEIAKRLGGLGPNALPNVTTAAAALEAKHQAARDFTPTEKKILHLQYDAVTSGAFAAALYREGLTIARADAPSIERLKADEYEAFQDGRQMFIPKLKEGELCAVNRFGGVHSLNPQNLDLASIEAALTTGARTIPTLDSARDQSARDQETAQQRREQKNASFWEGKLARDEAWKEKSAKFRAEHIARVERKTPKQQASRAAQSGLRVASGATGAAVKLTDFVLNLFSASDPKPPPDPKTLGVRAQIVAQRKALDAIENLRESMERGENLRASDIRNLLPNHLENIRLHGDKFIHDLIDDLKRTQERERDHGRERER